MSFYYTYVLKSDVDNNLYIGYTPNLKRRLKEHFNGEVKATKHRRLLTLVYFEGCRSKESAIKREKQLKTGFGRKYIINRL